MKLVAKTLSSKKIYYFSESKKFAPELFLLFSKKKKRFYICGPLYFLEKYLDKKLHKGFKSKSNGIKKLKTLIMTLKKLSDKEKKKLALFNVYGKEYPKETFRELEISLADNYCEIICKHLKSRK